MSDRTTHRLVTFLGKPAGGSYKRAKYLNPTDSKPESFETDLVAEALLKFLKPKELFVLATEDAWESLGGKIQEAARRSGVEFMRKRMPVGETKEELWRQFEVLKDALRLPEGVGEQRVALDITHGFRSLPFFASGAMVFLRLVDRDPPVFSIYYGAFNPSGADEDGNTPIWDLTLLNDLITWSFDIMLFIKTGRAGELASATEKIGRSLRKEWVDAGRQGPPPNIDDLGRALRRFGDDLETVRTGSLMLKNSSAKALRKEILAVQNNEDLVPPLKDVLGRIGEFLAPIITDSALSDPEGLRSLRSLARLYFEMGRYAEAASTMREAYINRYACPMSNCPGQPDFRKDCRDAAKERWYGANTDLARKISDVRNDIDHAGYSKHPKKSNTIKEMIDRLIDGIDAEIELDKADENG